MITGTAECGMRYAVRRGGSAVAYCALSIQCGTRDEDNFHSGIAHFTEHTIFRGCKHKSGSVINGYLDKLGGELNAYTTKEEIVLHSMVLKEDISKAAGLLMELVSTPTFPEKEINTERGVVIDEIKSYKDSPSEDVYDRFEEKLFAGHPLSRPILGTEDSVNAISSSELSRFVKEKFIPGKMAFTIVADIDEKRMETLVLRLADKFFHGMTMPAISCSRPMWHSFSPRFDESIDKGNNEANAVIGGFAPSLYDETGRYATILLSNILAGPATNSILNSVLREKNGWVYAVESGYTQYSDTGILTISLGCDPENLHKCCTAVRKEILKLQTIPYPEKKLKAAKKQLLGQLAISSDNGESRCLGMGKSLLAYGRIAGSEETREKILDITAEQMMEAAQRIFTPERTSFLAII